MAVNFFNDNERSTRSAQEDLIDQMREELDNKISKISNAVGGKLIESVTGGEIRETYILRKQQYQIQGSNLRGRAGCPIFAKPIILEYNTIIKRIIVQVHLKSGQSDKTKSVVLKYRSPLMPKTFVITTHFPLDSGTTYKVFEQNINLLKSSYWNLEFEVDGLEDASSLIDHVYVTYYYTEE